MKKFVSIDIGGTAIKFGLLNQAGEILTSGEMATEPYKGGVSILEKAIGIVQDYKTETEISGICISTAGMVDVEKGEIFYAAPLIPNYTGTKLKETMERRFGVPCEVENDVNCAGLAEYICGASKGSNVALMLTIGTGIGGCIIIDGKVFRGYSGSACEVGYMHMFGSDFQTLGAASVLTYKINEWRNEPQDAWNGIRIFEEAKKGDVFCVKAIDEMIDVLGQGIANICYVVNPEVVVLGGGIMAQEAYLKEKIQNRLNHWLIPEIAAKTNLAFAKHKNHAGMIGAFYHFRQMQNLRANILV